jgi:hypothetical protein
MAAVEYDHPERDQASSAKWSAITNVTILHGCVKRAVFGPKKYISDLAAIIQGKESTSQTAQFMHASLRISDVVPAVVEERDRSLQREDINRENFPRSLLPQIEEQFMKSWGYLLVRMLNDLTPFKVHGQALEELRSGWSGSGSTGALAKGAIFEGFGMYWTLRDSYIHWRETNKIRAQSNQPSLAKTDVVHAWDETERKRTEFEQIRARLYLGAANARAVEASKGAFDVFSTHACQLGFVFATRSLAFLGEVPFENLKPFIDGIIEGANAGLASEEPGEFGRKNFLSKGASHALNVIPKLDTPCAVYFRYFWLELLGSKEASPSVEKVVKGAVLDDAIHRARRHYYEKMKEISRKSLRNVHDDWDTQKINKQAEDEARRRLGKALSKWFSISQEVFDAWVKSTPEDVPPNGTQPAAEGQGSDAPTAEEEQGGEEKEEPDTLEELLEEDKPD